MKKTALVLLAIAAMCGAAGAACPEEMPGPPWQSVMVTGNPEDVVHCDYITNVQGHSSIAIGEASVTLWAEQRAYDLLKKETYRNNANVALVFSFYAHDGSSSYRAQAYACRCP